MHGLTDRAGSRKIQKVLCGPVAQLGARFHGMEEVVGSIPTRSTKSFQIFSRFPPKPFARKLQKLTARRHNFFFSSLPEPLFGSVVELRPWLKTP